MSKQVRDSLGILGAKKKRSNQSGQQETAVSVQDSLGILQGQSEPESTSKTRQKGTSQANTSVSDSLKVLQGGPDQGEASSIEVNLGASRSDPGFTKSTARIPGTELSDLEKKKRAYQYRKETIQEGMEAPSAVGITKAQGEAALEQLGEKPGEQLGFWESLQHVPEETAGLVSRPFVKTGEMLNRIVAKGAELAEQDDTADYWKQQADYMENLNKRLKTPLTDPRFDLAASLALGTLGGGAGYAATARNLPKALRGMRALRAAMGTGGSTAMLTDYGINRFMERVDPLIEKSGLSQSSGDVLRAALDLGLGFASAGTLESRIASMLDDPTMTRSVDDVIQRGGTPEEVMERFKNTAPASEWSPEISQKELARLQKARRRAGVDTDDSDVEAMPEHTPRTTGTDQPAEDIPAPSREIPEEETALPGDVRQDTQIEVGTSTTPTREADYERTGAEGSRITEDISAPSTDQGTLAREQTVNRILDATERGDIFDSHVQINKELDEANISADEARAIGDTLDDYLDEVEAGAFDKGALSSRIRSVLQEPPSRKSAADEVDTEAEDIVREQELETYRRGVGRIREMGGLKYDDVRKQFGQEGVEELRSKFGFDFVRKQGEPIDTAAQNLAEESPELGIRSGDKNSLWDFLTDKAKSKKQIQSQKYLRSSPAATLGAVAGIEEDQEGNITIDPKKALLGMAGAAAVGAPIVSLSRPGKKLARDIATKWDENFASPFLDMVRNQVDKRITNESFRRAWGMGRDPEMKRLMRQYNRQLDTSWSKALEIGQELQRIAPTKLEQKRLMQVLRGSVTTNKDMARKAEQVQKLFGDLREEMEQLHLLDYSRYDNLTRRQRAEIRKKLNVPDPATLNRPSEIRKAAQQVGVDLGKSIERGLESADPRQMEIATLEAQKKIRDTLQFERQRFRDFYHYASAEEYVPLKYSVHEGMTAQEKRDLKKTINDLKKKSRKGTPEGKQELEEIIVPLEKILKKGGDVQINKRKVAMDLGATQHRKDLPKVTQKILGKIEEAPYPTAKGAGEQMTDVAKAKLFDEISRHPEWAFKPTRGQDIPGNFVKVYDDRLGALKGMAVRQDVYDDLKETVDMRNDFIRLWDKALGSWKYGKVVLNPATHARNFMSNAILAYFGDVHPGDLKTYSRAAKELKNKGVLYQEAKDWGLFRNTFASAEIGNFRDNLGQLRNSRDLKRGIRNLLSVPSNLYGKNEEFFKMAVYTKARDQGASVDEAAQKAEKYLFNYADIPPAVKHIKRWVSPFFTFTYKALPRVAETAIRKPWKLGMLSGAMYGAEELARMRFGRTKEEQEAREKALPSWQQGFDQVLMPFKDRWGNDLYLDMGYILPYGEISQEWGQSPLPSIVTPAMPKHPMLDFFAALSTNKDPFTGRPIYYEHADTATDVTKKYLDYVWKQAMPSMAPGGYSFNKIKTGLKNAFRPPDEKITDWADRPRDLKTALLHSLLGIKLNPVDEEQLRKNLSYERSQAKREFGKKEAKLQRQMKRNEISRKEYREKLRDLQRQKQEVLKSLRLNKSK
jgi:hypothetical protein